MSDSKDITGRVEMAISMWVAGSREGTKKIVYKQFLEDNIIFVAPLAFPSSIEIRDITTHPVLIREPGSGQRR